VTYKFGVIINQLGDVHIVDMETAG